GLRPVVARSARDARTRSGLDDDRLSPSPRRSEKRLDGQRAHRASAALAGLPGHSTADADAVVRRHRPDRRQLAGRSTEHPPARGRARTGAPDARDRRAGAARRGARSRPLAEGPRVALGGAEPPLLVSPSRPARGPPRHEAAATGDRLLSDGVAYDRIRRP